MQGENESKDQKEARILAIALGALALLVFLGGLLAWPMLVEFHQVYLAPGVGMKDAAMISFIITVVVLVVFAVAAGDGLIGEIQFMLIGFFAFFLVLWMLIGWVF